eukprot:COSAG02_NODE_526_length_20707_cov_11.431337_18_plen_125_part_00
MLRPKSPLNLGTSLMMGHPHDVDESNELADPPRTCMLNVRELTAPCCGTRPRARFKNLYAGPSRCGTGRAWLPGVTKGEGGGWRRGGAGLALQFILRSPEECNMDNIMYNQALCHTTDGRGGAD